MKRITERIAFLGLGAMGSRMAMNLISEGHHLVVYNRSAKRAHALVEAGAELAQSPKEAAEKADVLISMVSDNEASRSIWLDEGTGAIHGLEPGAVVIESSTLTLEWTNELADLVAKKEVGFLDAPVAGSRPQAEAKKLIYLVGGEAEVFERVKPILAQMGGAIHHAGPTGHGMILKLVINAMFGIQAAAIAELLGMIRQSGVNVEQAVEILGQTPVISPAIKGLSGLMVAEKYDPMFPIDLVEKDFRYIIETAQFVHSDVPTVEAVRELYAKAQGAGFGGDNITGIAQLYTQQTASEASQ